MFTFLLSSVNYFSGLTAVYWDRNLKIKEKSETKNEPKNDGLVKAILMICLWMS